MIKDGIGNHQLYMMKKKNEAPTFKKENKLCNGDIENCNSCKYLIVLLNRYNKLLENNDNDNGDVSALYDEYRDEIEVILNNFHHYMLWHDNKKDIDDENIDYMYQSLL